MTLDERIWLATIALAVAGASLFCMFMYTSWYVAKGKPGDTIGALYHKGNVPKGAFFGLCLIISAAFWWLPWKHATGALISIPFLSGFLLTILRSRMQWVGFLVAPAGFIAGFLLSRP